MALAKLTGLPKKLEYFFAEARERSDAPFPIHNKRGLAKHLDIPPPRITEWTRADPSKGRDENSVQLDHLDEIARLFMLLAREPCTLDDARSHWRNDTPERFRDALVGRREYRTLHQLLGSREPRVEIELYIQPEPRRDGLNMLAATAEPEPGTPLVEVGEEFWLDVKRVRGRCVYLLMEAPEGLFLALPSRADPGRLRAPVLRIPGENFWRFSTDGHHRFIAIEMSCETQPWLRSVEDRVQSRLTDREIEALAASLLDAGRVPHWEWGKLLVYAKAK